VNYPTTDSTDARFPCAFFGFWDYVLALGSGHKSALVARVLACAGHHNKRIALTSVLKPSPDSSDEMRVQDCNSGWASGWLTFVPPVPERLRFGTGVKRPGAVDLLFGAQAVAVDPGMDSNHGT